MSRLLRAIIQEVAELPMDDEQMSKSMRATLSGTSRPIPPPPNSAYEHFVVDIFDAYSEFWRSYENVVSAANITRLRFKKPWTVTRLEFLTFILEASLNEFYIFSQRLDTLFKVIAKKYRNDHQFAALHRFLPRMSNIVIKTLKPIVEIRGAHVHQRRFSSGDEKIKRAQTLELLVAEGKMKRLRPIHRTAMSDAEKYVFQTTRTLVRNVKAIGGGTAKHLCSHLIDQDGRLRHPSNIKRSSLLAIPPA
jgi:hypothetical protein